MSRTKTSHKTQKEVAERVAKALATVSPLAGQNIDVDARQSVETRTKNLLKRHETYGAYIEPGDPHGWGGETAVCTIYMEQKGDKDDCIVPLDYYGGGHEFAMRASEQLDGYYIDFINAAVACVYAV